MRSTEFHTGEAWVAAGRAQTAESVEKAREWFEVADHHALQAFWASWMSNDAEEIKLSDSAAEAVCAAELAVARFES